MCFDQAGFHRCCEWGLPGVHTLGAVDAIVIVDVLSFSTAVDIAVSRGACVLPCSWKDETAKQFAADKGAILASRRFGDGPYSLSPASLLNIPRGTRLVLPSPNGSTLSLATNNIPTFTACLRNAPAVAKRATLRGSRIAVIPAGEHWPDGSLRPCVEDLIGAGAVLADLPGTASPEAELAVAAFLRFQDRLASVLRECSSGRELAQLGFESDIEIAAKYAVSSTSPILSSDQFVDDCARDSLEQ